MICDNAANQTENKESKVLTWWLEGMQINTSKCLSEHKKTFKNQKATLNDTYNFYIINSYLH